MTSERVIINQWKEFTCEEISHTNSFDQQKIAFLDSFFWVLKCNSYEFIKGLTEHMFRKKKIVILTFSGLYIIFWLSSFKIERLWWFLMIYFFLLYKHFILVFHFDLCQNWNVSGSDAFCRNIGPNYITFKDKFTF